MITHKVIAMLFLGIQAVSYTHLDVYKRQAFNELGSGFVNDRQVDIAVMGI